MRPVRVLLALLVALALPVPQARAEGVTGRPFVDVLTGQIQARFIELVGDLSRCLHPDRERWTLAFLGIVPNSGFVTPTEAQLLNAMIQEAIGKANLPITLTDVEMNREIARLARTSVENEAFLEQLARQGEATFVLAVHPGRVDADTVVLAISMLARNADGVYSCNRPITLMVDLPNRTVRSGFPTGELLTLDGAYARFLDQNARFLRGRDVIGLAASSALVGNCSLSVNVEAMFLNIYSQIADDVSGATLENERLPDFDPAVGADALTLHVALLSQRRDRVVRVALGLREGTRRIRERLFDAVVDPRDLEGCDAALVDLSAAVEELTERRDRLAEEVATLAARDGALRSDVSALRQALVAAREELRGVEASRERIMDEIARLERERVAAEAAVRDAGALAEETAGARRALEAARADLAEAEAAAARARGELRRIEGERDSLRREIAGLRGEAAGATRARDGARADRDRLAREIEGLRGTLADLRRQEREAAAALAVAVADAQKRARWTPPSAPRARFREPLEGGGFGPEMVVIPAGSFWMGSPDGTDGRPAEAGRDGDEGPQHRRTIASFALSRSEVTFDQWQACVDDGGCRSNPRPGDRGWGRGSRPVINVSERDAQEFVRWINGKVEGEPYRLPSEAEWEYAARADENGRQDGPPYHFGTTITSAQANFGRNVGRTVPVDDLPAAENRWGLRHMHGNVWEWTEDCWHDSYRDAPSDQRAWREENGGDCARRVVRGGSWYDLPQFLRSANRGGVGPGSRSYDRGFRLARTLLTP